MTLSAAELPSTYRLPWPALAGAYLQILELGIEEHSNELRCLLFFAGNYYSVLWFVAHDQGKTNYFFPIHTEDDQLDKVCRMGLRKLDTLMKSRDTARDVAVAEECFGDLPAPTWATLVMSMLNLEGALQQKVRRWLEQEPVKENAIRFYFGLGIEAHIHSFTLYAGLASEPLIVLRDAKKVSALSEVFKNHFAWSEERTSVRH